MPGNTFLPETETEIEIEKDCVNTNDVPPETHIQHTLSLAEPTIKEIIQRFSFYLAHRFNPRYQINCEGGNYKKDVTLFAHHFCYDENDAQYFFNLLNKTLNYCFRMAQKNIFFPELKMFIHYFVKDLETCLHKHNVPSDDPIVLSSIAAHIQQIPLHCGALLGKYYHQNDFSLEKNQKWIQKKLEETMDNLAQFSKHFKLEPQELLKDFKQNLGRAIDVARNKPHARKRQPYLELFFLARRHRSSMKGTKEAVHVVGHLPKPLLIQIVNQAFPNDEMSVETDFRNMK